MLFKSIGVWNYERAALRAVFSRGGPINFFKNSANRKSANSLAHFVITNPQIFMGVPGLARLHIANLQISMINPLLQI